MIVEVCESESRAEKWLSKQTPVQMFEKILPPCNKASHFVVLMLLVGHDTFDFC